jgi:hypothetical protein
MKIEKVNEPQWSITITEKERQALEDIFGNMASCHLRDIMGSTKLEHFVLDFYKTVSLEN